MDNFDLRKFLAEGKLFEETAGYAYASNSGDRIELWSEESLNDYVSGMAEDDYSGDKEAAMEYMKNENMLTRLPSSPYLFIYGNNESLDFFDANTKEEFVELINEEYHGGLEGDVDAMFAKILEYADNSYIDGDSSSQQVVIENGKVVGGGNSLSEGQLNEAMSPQDVVDIADTVAEEFTKESAEDGDFLVYSVGKMEADDMSFELDTDVTSQTPKSIDTRGVGEGWGGIFRIKPTEDGYEVRNAEKGGLVAMIDAMGNFRMLSADESRAEMGMEEGPIYPEDKHLMTPDEFGDDEIDMDRYNDELDMDRYNDELDMDRMEENKTLNEGLFDTVKDKLLAAKDKIMSKVSPEAIAMFKDKVEQALGKPASELGVEDLTLSNAKKVGALVKDQLSEEETLNEGVKETIGGILGVLGLATAVSAGLGGAVWISVAGLVMLAISWMTSLEESLNEKQENKPSNKMKKSELKEMIKAAMLEDARTDAEQEGYKDGFEDAKDDIEDKLKDMKVSEAEDVDVEKDVDVDVEDDENVDVDIEKDIEVDDEETEADIDVKASVSGESKDVEAVQGLLTKALEMSQALGDEKLEDQIGNTITYFTRAHVSKLNELDLDIDDAANTEMEAELGLEEAKDEEVKENLNESVVFPMWNKIK